MRLATAASMLSLVLVLSAGTLRLLALLLALALLNWLRREGGLSGETGSLGELLTLELALLPGTLAVLTLRPTRAVCAVAGSSCAVSS
jgi:hypothetical protein